MGSTTRGQFGFIESEESGVSHGSKSLIARGHTLGRGRFWFHRSLCGVYVRCDSRHHTKASPSNHCQRNDWAEGVCDGSDAVTLGLGLHYLIAFTVATTYVVASRYITVLTVHPLLSGLLYGAAVHLFMTFIVLPLSSLKRPFSMTFFLGQLVIHMLCVGLPISLVVKHFSQVA